MAGGRCATPSPTVWAPSRGVCLVGPDCTSLVMPGLEHLFTGSFDTCVSSSELCLFRHCPHCQKPGCLAGLTGTSDHQKALPGENSFLDARLSDPGGGLLPPGMTHGLFKGQPLVAIHGRQAPTPRSLGCPLSSPSSLLPPPSPSGTEFCSRLK